MVNFHPRSWHESFTPVEQWQLQELWGALAQRLRPLSPDLTFPEVLNEPIYPEGVAPWEELQKKVLARIRAELPRETVIVTSNHWSAIDSLPALHPLPDRNLVYTFHIYEPMVLTALGDFDHTLDRSALRHLPFPVMGPNSCAAAESATMQKHTIDAIRFYCSEHWDSAKIQGLIDQAAEWGRRNHVPLVCGEFGASDGLPPATRFAWISAVRRALEERGIGWALWGYDDSMGFHAHPYGSPPAPLNPGLLHALGLDDHV
jgi:endoglucanase